MFRPALPLVMLFSLTLTVQQQDSLSSLFLRFRVCEGWEEAAPHGLRGAVRASVTEAGVVSPDGQEAYEPRCLSFLRGFH